MILKQDSIEGVAGEFALEMIRREEHDCFQPRHANGSGGRLGSQERDEGFGFAVGQQHRIVFSDSFAVVSASPRGDVATDFASPAFDFNEPETLFGEYQQVNLVDGPVRGLEFEIGPRPVRFVVWQPGTDQVEGATFPFVLGRRDGVPEGRFHEWVSWSFAVA